MKHKDSINDKVIWESIVIPGLAMTERMLKLLHYRYSHVKSWRSLMLELETYLVSKPEKTPKNFKRFVLNCAKRRAEDVRKGLRHPDGSVNLKAFENRGPERPKREESMTEQTATQEVRKLREKLVTLERGTEDYETTLAQLKRIKETKPAMSLGEILRRLSAEEISQT